MPELLRLLGGEVALLQGGDLDPLLGRGLLRAPPLSILGAGDLLLGAREAHRLGIVCAEGQACGVPQPDVSGAPSSRWSKHTSGARKAKRAAALLIHLAVLLLQRDNQFPADLLRQLQHRRLDVERVRQEDVEEGASVEFGQARRQAPRGGLFPLARPDPLQGQDGLDGSADDPASHGAVVVLRLLDRPAVSVPNGDAALETRLATAAVAGEHLDAIQGRYDADPPAARLESHVALEAPVDMDQHLLEPVQVEAAKAVAQQLVAERLFQTEPVWQGGFGRLRFRLSEAGQAEDKGVEDSQEHARRKEGGVVAGVV